MSLSLSMSLSLNVSLSQCLARDGRSPQSQTIEALRETFVAGTTRPYEWRMAQLKQLKAMLHENLTMLGDAVRADLGKSTGEFVVSEIFPVITDIAHTMDHLRGWMKGQPIQAPLLVATSRCRVVPEPRGVVLILGAWNYPVYLLIGPLVAALAAGNVAVLKPSEVATQSCAALVTLLQRYMDPRAVRVLNGGPSLASALIAKPSLDLIFFTGSTRVGRLVAQAAAANLTPTILELGGKCPVIVDETANLRTAARRLAWAKTMNSGQTCISPDHLFVHASVHDAFLAELRATLAEGETTVLDATLPDAAPRAHTRLVHQHHHEGLARVLAEQLETNPASQIAIGGRHDAALRAFELTVVTGVGADPAANPLMREEIFGPILPIIPYTDLDAVTASIRACPPPLALYVFSTQRGPVEKLRQATTSGTFMVNDALVNMTAPALPFGGIGASGQGRYHGYAGFEALSNMRSVFVASAGQEWLNRFRPPAPSWAYSNESRGPPPYQRLRTSATPGLPWGSDGLVQLGEAWIGSLEDRIAWGIPFS
ncbi:hypothetical protein CXG81DRAFT_30189 [Caulochytrium protostelioides]|uniref:Aldehyde dehydrogenase n=1 Tax=Caulochytrium protostelioides TaxID=1555241 RepID=A0A4P9X3B1_9FUNG|nr:hypothetical protein CXG81DRAFT_30189 [Caulochytrium protostelioides]|eukprot:RKO99506.1 hypothetical protein CXG81DRAFT_30189 [Caulochytrium protostelioides]